MVNYEMPTNAEMIEKLAKQLEQQKILNALECCKTLEDYQELTKQYQAICKEHN